MFKYYLNTIARGKLKSYAISFPKRNIPVVTTTEDDDQEREITGGDMIALDIEMETKRKSRKEPTHVSGWGGWGDGCDSQGLFSFTA